MVKNRTRRNKKSEGGSSCGMKLTGGKRRKSARRTRKMSKGASEWNKKVMEVYRDMKKKDSSVRLGDAMKKAAEMKRKGHF
jgi:hypothetical protein